MKRFLAAMFVLFSVLSCGKNGTDGVYISVCNTSWEIRADNQVAWPSFIGSDQAAIVMYTSEYNAFQILNGSYTVDGHRVSVAAESTVTMVRTFSHLKNSSNKNYTKLSPEAPASVGGSVWVTVKDADLYFIYHRQDGTLLEGAYPNMTRKEGFDYGWTWTTGTYSVSGNQYTAGEQTGTFFGNKFLLLEDKSFPCIATSENMEGTSSLKGTVWTYVSSAYPGFILFTSATEFVRVVVSSSTLFYVLQGEYSLKENSLEFMTDSEELNRTCTISDGRFTYLEKTYSLVSF